MIKSQSFSGISPQAVDFTTFSSVYSLFYFFIFLPCPPLTSLSAAFLTCILKVLNAAVFLCKWDRNVEEVGVGRNPFLPDETGFKIVLRQSFPHPTFPMSWLLYGKGLGVVFHSGYSSSHPDRTTRGSFLDPRNKFLIGCFGGEAHESISSSKTIRLLSC